MDRQLNIQDLWQQKSKTHQVVMNQNGNQMITLYQGQQKIQSQNGWRDIKRIFRHRVMKQRWKIWIDGMQSPLYITADHSIMVVRDGRVIQSTVKQLREGDKFKIGNKQIDISLFQIKSDGYFCDQNVYDIQVSDQSHTFFGNDILLHNSIYVRMDAIIKKLFGQNKNIDWNNKEIFSTVKNYVDNTFQIKLNDYCADFICNTFYTDQRRIQFKRQKISAQGQYTAKKHYIVHVYDNEGLECNKWAYAGVQIKKNQLPETIKKLLKQCVQGMIQFNWSNQKFQTKVQEMYDIFNNMSINDISYIKNLGTPKNVEGFLILQKGAGAHVKGAEFYNQLIKELNITNKYEQIRQHDRFHYLYIKSNNKYGINVIGYKDRWPKEFDNLFEIDRIKMFQKAVLAPFKQIIINHGFSAFNPTQISILGQNGVSVFDL